MHIVYILNILTSILLNCFNFPFLITIGHRLSNSLIYEKEVHSAMDCAHLCLSAEHPPCKSINYEKQEKLHGGRRSKCQLNNKTKAMEPNELVLDFAFNYFEPFKVSLDILL